MREERFFLTGKDLLRLEKQNMTSDLISLSEHDLIFQWRHVLRFQAGQHILLLDGKNNCYETELISLSKQEAICKILKLRNTNKSTKSIHVALSLIKATRFEWCIEKLTELGADIIQPLICKHSLSKAKYSQESNQKEQLNNSEINKRERWQKIAKEAAEQCERTTIPQIVSPIYFQEYIQKTELNSSSIAYICTERIKQNYLFQDLSQYISNTNISSQSLLSTIILIGPEGGFSQEESLLAESSGFKAVSLGKRILRSETAAIVACSQVASLLDI